jgi:hypothetical protein
MGRPLNKKYFGNRNVGSASTTADDGVGGEGVASVTLGGTWSGFTGATTTVTFTAPQLPGGVTATGTAVINGGGTITSITITEPGSGYTSAPTVTIVDSDVGAETTGTATAVLTSGSSTNASQNPTGTNENAIRCYAYVTGGSRKVGDIIKQVSTTRYKVKTADGTMICSLVTDGVANAAGEMDITAYDSGSAGSNEYWVKKLTGRRATLVVKGSGGGSQFSTDRSTPWTLGSAVLNTSVRIDNA